MTLIVLLSFGAISAQAGSLPVAGSTSSWRSLFSFSAPSREGVVIKSLNGTNTETTVRDINRQFGKALFFVDLTLVVLSALFGYILSGLTLRPIQKAMKEQEEFAQEASHELRTPLAVIGMEMEALRRTEAHIKPSYMAAFKNIDEELKRMGALVGGLVSLVSPDGRHRPELHQSVDITATAKKAFLQLKKIAQEKQLAYAFSSTYEGKVKGGEEDIRQIIIILLDNAIKYSAHDGSVALRIGKSGKMVVIEVEDQGIGISKEDTPRIFDRFYRTKNRSLVKQTDGLGLGLSIARKKVELHHGKLTVDSELGKGASFKVYLPLARA
jgi:signal transduction histidine kinase